MSCLRHQRSFFVVAAMAIAAMLVAGCFGATDLATRTAGTADTIPAPQVSVATATTETIADERKFTGQLAKIAGHIRPLDRFCIGDIATNMQLNNTASPQNGLQAVFDLLSILTHHDYGGLHRCQAREEQV